jgi:hypothetical protein
MGQVIGTIAVVTFWIFITIVSVAGIMYDYRKKRLVVDTVRHAIQHGAQIDPALLDRLLSDQKYADAQEQALDPRLLKIGGIITIASGIGLLPLSAFIAQVREVARFPIMGVGVLAICVGIGIGLLLSARVLAREPAPGNPGDRGA